MNSLGWLKCVLKKSGWYFLSMAHSSGVMRCGNTTGTREPRRTISTWSMARTRARISSSFSSDRTSGSPPLISTSRTSGERSMYLMALSISALATMSSVPPDQAPAGAVPAVHRAHLGDHEQDAIGIAVGDARRRRVEVLADGVLHVLGAHDELGRRGDALHAHRAVRVVGVHERGVVGRDRHAELAHAGLEVGALLGREVEHLLEVGDGGQPVGELPVVVVPLASRTRL